MYNISVYYLYGGRCNGSYPAYVTTSKYPTASDYIRRNSGIIINTNVCIQLKLQTSYQSITTHSGIPQNVTTSLPTRRAPANRPRSSHTPQRAQRDHLGSRNSKTPSPTQSHLLTTSTRQQVVSSPLHSSPSPAHRPTTAVASPCTHSSHGSHIAAGHKIPSNPTAVQPMPSSLASPSTRVRHWEARIPSARAEPQGRQGERLVTAHQAT